MTANGRCRTIWFRDNKTFTAATGRLPRARMCFNRIICFLSHNLLPSFVRFWRSIAASRRPGITRGRCSNR